jgi:hypothetical protein
MLLVRTADADVLRRLAPTVHDWMAAGNPPPLVLTIAEWRRRSDVFAIEYADLLERHRVVFGSLPLEGIVVRSRDLRTQLESEITGKLLRFRRGVMHAGTDDAAARGLLAESLPAMLALLRATLHLHGEAAPDSAEAVCVRAGVLASFDPSAFRAVIAQRRDGVDVPARELRRVIAGYLAALESLLNHTDGFAASDQPLSFPLSSEVS